MSFVTKFMMFSITFNFAVGLMLTAIPIFDSNPVYKSNLVYNSNMTGGFEESARQEVNPTGLLENIGDAFDRLLDTIGLGLIKRFLEIIDTYMYGFIKVLDNVFGGYLESNLHALIFGRVGILKSLITVGYVIGGIQLWTNKDMRN